MANDAAWAEGIQIGSQRAQEGRAHKQVMSDAEFQEKHNEIQGMIDNLQTRLSTIPDKNSEEYLKAQDALAQALQARDAHWKSLSHPSPILKFGKLLGKDLRFKKQAAPVPVAPPVYGQPTSTIPQSSDEPVVLGGEPGAPSATVTGLGKSDEQPTTVNTGPAYKVEGPQTPAQIKAQAEALRMSTSGPLSPVEQQRMQDEVAQESIRRSNDFKLAEFKRIKPRRYPRRDRAVQERSLGVRESHPRKGEVGLDSGKDR